MTTNICKTALALGLFCLPLTPMAAYAEISPEQFNLLMVASKKDGGKDFQTLVELLIAANPDDETEIRNIACHVSSLGK